MISIEVGAGATMVPASDLVSPVAVALQATARPSDPKGRVTATDFAVLAPGANEGGAQSMATRLKQAVQNAIEMTGLPPGTCRVIVAYDAVANLAYTPVEPTEILARATTALRDRRRFAET
jgi:GGDEF domain-containing protein